MNTLVLLAALLSQAPTDADVEDVKPVVANVTADPATPEALPPLADGIYFLVVKAGQPSQISTVRTAVVVGPGPVPPVPGPTPALNDFGKAIKAAAEKAVGDTDRANTAQGLAVLYRAVSAEAHKQGTTATLETISSTVLTITDAALNKQGAAAAWAETRAVLRAAMVDAIQTGKTVPQMGDLLDQAAAGLDASAPKMASQAPSPAFWDFIMKLILQLLPLLLNLK